MFCMHCGAEVKDDAEICMNCGCSILSSQELKAKKNGDAQRDFAKKLGIDVQIELKDGENLIMSDFANKKQVIGVKCGKLFLTDQRLIFKAYALNFGSKFDEYALSEIAVQEKTVDIKVASLGGSYSITFYTKSGEKLSFIVMKDKKDAWIRKITETVVSYQGKN